MGSVHALLNGGSLLFTVTISTLALFRRLLWGARYDNEAMWWGRMHEATALDAYRQFYAEAYGEVSQFASPSSTPIGTLCGSHIAIIVPSVTPLPTAIAITLWQPSVYHHSLPVLGSTLAPIHMFRCIWCSPAQQFCLLLIEIDLSPVFPIGECEYNTPWHLSLREVAFHGGQP